MCEFVEGVTNELVMPLRQFMHVVYLTPNFLQLYFSKFERKHYTVMVDGDWYSLLLGATISVTIEHYEDGDTFINEVTGEEEASEGVTYHTRATKIKVAACVASLLFVVKMMRMLLKLLFQALRILLQLYTSLLSKQKLRKLLSNELQEWERNLLLLLLIGLLTTRTTQVDYNKVTRVDNKKETNSEYRNQNTYKTFYKLYKTYSIDIVNDNEYIT